VPSDYDSNHLYPLVLLFHGGNGAGTVLDTVAGDTQSSIDRMLEGTGFIQKAEANNFIVVAPAGVDGNWNDGRGTSEPELQGVDDVAFVRELLNVLESSYSIDTTRVYATGVSNGGMMSHRLGCEIPDRIAAVGAVASAIPIPVAEDCTAATPAVGIQGTADPLLPFDGSGATRFAKAMNSDGTPKILSAAATMELLSKNNNCDAVPVTTKLPILEDDGTSVTKYSYQNCTVPRAVEYYVVEGMGHGWPPHSRLTFITGPTSHNINATDVVWEFFSAHTNVQ
jgi:polyhydroxybutyrate depolymerase